MKLAQRDIQLGLQVRDPAQLNLGIDAELTDGVHERREALRRNTGLSPFASRSARAGGSRFPALAAGPLGSSRASPTRGGQRLRPFRVLRQVALLLQGRPFALLGLVKSGRIAFAVRLVAGAVRRLERVLDPFGAGAFRHRVREFPESIR